MKPAPDEQSSPSIVKLRVDRYALADIASNKDVLSALLQISFSINGIRTTYRRETFEVNRNLAARMLALNPSPLLDLVLNAPPAVDSRLESAPRIEVT